MPIGTGADFAKEVEDTDENVITMPIGTGAYYAGDPEDLVEHLPIGKGAVPAQLQNPYRVMKSAGYDMKRFPPIDRRHHFEEQKPLKRSEEDEKALLHPCSSVHTAFARRREKQGCKGALAFVRKVCSDFFDCLFKRTSTDVNCEAKICEQFNIVEREEACYNDLFICV
ncbi:hypothetical protein OESDEN_19067 [Oesophagostomum dentatum]|uniref:Uncharacterized protein n=1 Tax=Oesophagostomum dentatum TaxID=61180 RepID=A0A0B1SCI8_OESDE|nr:hypothetical protein OESDEN_19067 [Oesophagostomum dentatum]